MNSRPAFFRRFVASGLVLIVAAAGSVIGAQEPAQSATGQPATQILSPEQLNDLVAPIALYSDPLLSQVLAASLPRVAAPISISVKSSS